MTKTSECVGLLHTYYTQYKSEAIHIHTQGKKSAAWGSYSTWARRKLSAQIAFLELIISFYVIHLSVVIVCQSNAVAARYEVECKFCLGNSLLCTKRGWPRCRIYIYNYSHDTIISHHNSSARDVSSDREQASRSAYQTAAWQAWHSASGPVIYTMRSLSQLLHTSSIVLSASLFVSAPVFLAACLSLSRKSTKTWRVRPGPARHFLLHLMWRRSNMLRRTCQGVIMSFVKSRPVWLVMFPGVSFFALLLFSGGRRKLNSLSQRCRAGCQRLLLFSCLM